MHRYIFVHAPELPRTLESLEVIFDRIRLSAMPYDKMFVCCTKGFDEVVKAKFPDLSRTTFLDTGFGPEEYEYPTLKVIYEMALLEDFSCLYLHSKGASKTREDEYHNAKCWMDFMLYGVVDNYKVCLSHLERPDGPDLVGSQWHWHFKGNFWWAKSSHLREMPDPMGIGDERFNAEYWCCLGLWWHGYKKSRIKNLFYLPDLNDDTKFFELHKLIPVNGIDLLRKYAFIDKRIDPQQAYTLADFINENYKCALDEIYILKSDIGLLSYFQWFLNYDATITALEHDEAGTYNTYTLDEAIKEFDLF